MHIPRVRLRRKNVDVALAKMNLSQSMFSYKLMIPSGSFSQYMTGQRCLSPLMRRRISRLLKDYSWDYIYEVIEK